MKKRLKSSLLILLFLLATDTITKTDLGFMQNYKYTDCFFNQKEKIVECSLVNLKHK